MSKVYGVPYKGSKNTIATDIVAQLPPAETFVDLFAGGAAVTHAAIESGKYKHYILNDLDPRGAQLFYDAISGKQFNASRWVSREDFMNERFTDPYVGLVWSFGSNGLDYMYSKKIEPYKKKLHEAIFADTPYERLASFRSFIKSFVNDEKNVKNPMVLENLTRYQSLERLQRLQRFQELQHLERLQRLQSFRHLERFQNSVVISDKDFGEVNIPPDSVVYCDIPYNNTNGYKEKFDRERFIEWCRNAPFDVFVSEYDFPIGEVVWSKDKRVTINKSDNSLLKTEKLYKISNK